MEETFEELRCYFNAKVIEQGENLTKVFNDVLNDLREEITKQIQNEMKSHCKHLESENQMLKHQVLEHRRLNITNQNNHEKLEQYGRRLCLQINDVHTKTNESSDDVLDSVKSLFKEAKVDIPESIIDRAQIFRGFLKNKLKRGVRIKLDLTKSRYALLKRANDHVKEVPSIKFCYADVNCRLKVKFNDENQKDIFFSSFDDLRDIAAMEI